jgi:hypothetical protein
MAEMLMTVEVVQRGISPQGEQMALVEADDEQRFWTRASNLHEVDWDSYVM